MSNDLTYFDQEAYENIATSLVSFIEQFAIPTPNGDNPFFYCLDYLGYVNDHFDNCLHTDFRSIRSKINQDFLDIITELDEIIKAFDTVAENLSGATTKSVSAFDIASSGNASTKTTTKSSTKTTTKSSNATTTKKTTTTNTTTSSSGTGTRTTTTTSTGAKPSTGGVVSPVVKTTKDIKVTKEELSEIEKKKLQAQIEELKDEQNKSKAQIEENEKEKRILEHKIEKLENKDSEEVQKVRDELNEKIDKLDKDNTELQNRTNNLENEKANLQEQLNAKQHEIDELKNSKPSQTVVVQPSSGGGNSTPSAQQPSPAPSAIAPEEPAPTQQTIEEHNITETPVEESINLDNPTEETIDTTEPLPNPNTDSTTSKAKSSSGFNPIPLGIGLGAAVAGGIGIKAYADHKKNSKFDDENEDSVTNGNRFWTDEDPNVINSEQNDGNNLFENNYQAVENNNNDTWNVDQEAIADDNTFDLLSES